jgi:D-amino peptidase
VRIVISVDMEGISGIADRTQLLPGERLYAESRPHMAAEVKAVVRAAWAAGASAVTVNDSHDGMLNIGWAEMRDLPPQTRLISGAGKPWSMGQGFAEADGVMFIGYHAMAGTPAAIMDHTYRGDVHHLALNGREVGETGFNAYLAGHHGVPVLMVSGDRALGEEAADFLPEAEVVVTKDALSRRSALLFSPAEVAERLEEAAVRAVERLRRGAAPRPVRLDGPVELELGFMTTQAADTATLMPETRRVDGRTVAYTAADVPAAFRACRALMVLGGGTPLY